MQLGADVSRGREKLIAMAIAVFADRGIEATSLRAVARAAGVSPALVVHHFGSKAGLCEAVDAEIARLFVDAYAGAGEDTLIARSAAMVSVMRERPDVCAYLGRGLVEGTPSSTDLFARVYAHSRDEIEQQCAAGSMASDIDATWVALQHVLLLLGPLMLRAEVERVLGSSLLEDAGLLRWARANERLLRNGIYQETEEGNGTLGSSRES